MLGLVVPVVAVTLFKQALVSALSALGGKAASALLLDPLMVRVAHYRAMQAIGQSYDAAIVQFAKNVGNATLLAALNGDPSFWEDEGLHATLASAILDPEMRRDCVGDIERRFAALAPDQPPHLLHEAAKCLLRSLRDSVLGVTEFRKGLDELRANLRTGVWLTTTGRRRASNPPKLADGLQDDLLQRAEDEAVQCGHDFVGTAHLLLALADHAGSSASAILADANVTASRLRPVVTRVIRRRTPVAADGSLPRRPLPVTGSVRQSLQMACAAAEREDLDTAEDDQVLEALLDMVDLGQEGGKSVAAALRQLQVETRVLRAPLYQFLSVVQTLSY